MAASSSLTPQWNYDVFLSFRGEDTRNTFAGHLHRALVKEGINTFIDDENLERGDEISPSLYQAIEKSRIAIIVFSKNYATSKWCLDELVKILDCRKSFGQMVRPVFYHVDPSDVRKQIGTYEFALAQHEKVLKKDNERVKKWRQALTEAANLSGWDLANGHEPEFIQKIIDEVSSKLICTRLQVAENPVGINSRALFVRKHLNLRSEKVQMVGICGFGGIGKTTIAKAIYNQIADDFQGSIFLADVKDNSKRSDLVQLQERLLHKVLRDENLKVGNVDEGVHLIQNRLRFKRVVIVIDNVNHQDQLRYLAGKVDWFGSGSRIIITTRDKHLLIAHDVKAIYEVEKLNDAEAHELFMWNAFRKKSPPVEFTELAEEVVQYCNGLPLALIVLGSHLCGREKVAWRGLLQKLKRLPHKEIYKILKISYDGLDEDEQTIFLDIACFLNGKEEGYVRNSLESCSVHPDIGIPVLVEKCLITIEYNEVRMHNLIQEMGREIVRQESPNDPGSRSRLWLYEDIHQVLTQKKGIDKIRGIKLDLPETKEIQLSTDGFSKMKGLRLLICNGVFPGSLEYLPNELRLLDFTGCSSSSLAPVSLPEKLVLIHISHSLIKELGQGFKNLIFLKHIHFESCNFLRKIPDLSTAPNLETLTVEDCEGLVEVHNSIGFLNKLVKLKLFYCQNLRNIPKCLKLKALEELNLMGCSKLENFPERAEEMESLKFLDLQGTSINKLPSWIGGLPNLQDLYLDDCRFLTEIPDLSGTPNLKTLQLHGCTSLIQVHYSIGFLYNLSELLLSYCVNLTTFPANLKLKSLICLDLSGCQKLDKLPERVEEMGSLRKLFLQETSINKLPPWIGDLPKLESLYLMNCRYLTEIPDLSGTPNLKTLHLQGCTSLIEVHNSIGFLYNLSELDLINCVNLTTFPAYLKLKSLTSLCLSGCHKLDKLPEGVKEMRNLNGLDLKATSITELPSWIKNLSGLTSLRLNNCKKLTNLGSGISKLKNLTVLEISGCKRLKEIVDLPGSIAHVYADNCESLERYSQLDRTERYDCCYHFTNDWKMMNCLGNISERDMELDHGSLDFLYPGSEIPKWLGLHREISWETTIVDTTKQIVSMQVPRQILKNLVAITFGCVVGPGPRMAQPCPLMYLKVCDMGEMLMNSGIGPLELDHVRHMEDMLMYSEASHLESDHVWLYRLNYGIDRFAKRDGQLVFLFDVDPYKEKLDDTVLKKCAVHLTLDGYEGRGSNEQYLESTCETLQPIKPLEDKFLEREKTKCCLPVKLLVSLLLVSLLLVSLGTCLLLTSE